MGDIIAFDVGSRNLAICAATLDREGVATVRHWDVHDIAAPGRMDVLLNLFACLDDVVDALPQPERRLVLVENQPSRASGLMKAIQAGVLSYFCMRRYQRGEDVRVRDVNARAKLSGRDGQFCTAYKDRKRAAVTCVEALVADAPELVARLCEHRKQDDLCDSLLYVACPALTGFSRFADAGHLGG